MGSGKKTKSTTSVNIPAEVGKPLLGIGGQVLDPKQGQKAFTSAFLNPDSIARMQGVLGETAYGNKLNVMQDPAVQNYTNSLTKLSNSNLQNNLANLQSEAARSGHTSVGGSSALQGIMANTMGQSQNALNATMAPQLLNMADTERGRQLASVGALQQLEMLPYNMGRDIAGLWAGQNTNTNQRSPGMAGLMGK